MKLVFVLCLILTSELAFCQRTDQTSTSTLYHTNCFGAERKWHIYPENIPDTYYGGSGDARYYYGPGVVLDTIYDPPQSQNLIGINAGIIRVAYTFDLATIPKNVLVTDAVLQMQLEMSTWYPISGLTESFNLNIRGFEEGGFIPWNSTYAQQLFGDLAQGSIYDQVSYARTPGIWEQTGSYSHNFSASSQFARDISKKTGGLFSVALQNGFESVAAGDPNKHLIGVAPLPNHSYQWRDIKLYFTYITNVEFLNDFKTKDLTLGYDFTVTDNNSSRSRQHGDREGWQYNEAHTIVMYDHENVLYSSIDFPSTGDDKHYNRVAKHWEKKYLNDVSTNTGNTWSNVTITEPANFVANFYRLVDNQFMLYDLAPGFLTQSQPITSAEIGIDDDRNNIAEWSSPSPTVYQKRNEYIDHKFNVILPQIITEGNTTKYFVGWSPDDAMMRANSEVDIAKKEIRTTIYPNLHHKDSVYQHAYKAH